MLRALVSLKAVLIVAAWDYRKNIEDIYGAKNQ